MNRQSKEEIKHIDSMIGQIIIDGSAISFAEIRNDRVKPAVFIGQKFDHELMYNRMPPIIYCGVEDKHFRHLVMSGIRFQCPFCKQALQIPLAGVL